MIEISNSTVSTNLDEQQSAGQYTDLNREEEHIYEPIARDIVDNSLNRTNSLSINNYTDLVREDAEFATYEQMHMGKKISGKNQMPTTNNQHKNKRWLKYVAVIVLVCVLCVTCALYFTLSQAAQYQEETLCSGSPCQNGGQCHIQNNAFSCRCPDGYEGNTCQETPCSGSPCLNGGRCHIQNDIYNCECPEGYNGSECQETPCSVSPCRNGGQCHIQNNTYHCQCPGGYEGSECQETPCFGSPCLNGGRCQIQKNTYNCHCSEGYKGSECQETPCSRSPCLNGGQCQIRNSTYNCHCPAGYHGSDCQVTPCSGSPCLNGGQCRLQSNTYNCLCPAGFGGKECQVTPCSSQPCLNYGTCYIVRGSYSCACNRGYSGTRCENRRTCGANWSQHDDKCYYFSNEKRTFTGSKDVCLYERNSILAEPKTRNEIRFLKSKAKVKDRTFWIGGTDRQYEGNWRWATTGTLVTVTDWHTRTVIEPNNQNGRENCMSIEQLLDFDWNDDECSDEYSFICEKRLGA